MPLPDSITVDGFTALTTEAHALAIYNHTLRIMALKRRLQLSLQREEREQFSDELRHTQTLVKVHVVRMHEMIEEQDAVVGTAEAA
ncbi:hypothetical protein [Hymenobacter algoricola]|uniref:Uncharacterized protein n=1 Tax=Hymenobacter algoricola TaxID=486267 RepID=A0ABP7NTC4_9BACT